MKTFKYLPLALLASSFALSSCDDTMDCGCECNKPKAKSFEFLDLKTQNQIDEAKKNHEHTALRDSFEKKKVASGSVVIVYGENLSEITAIKYKTIKNDKVEYVNAILYPTLMNDNQIVFKVPEGLTTSSTPKFCTKACPTGVSGLPKVYLGSPCASMCDNEFATTTLKIKGNSLVDGLEAYFWSDAEQGYTLKTKCEVSADNASATVPVPAGYGKNHPILFKTGAGEQFSDFIFHDERGMMITRDGDNELMTSEKAELNLEEKFGITPDALIEKYVKSENSNGKYSIFYTDGTEYYTTTNYSLDAANNNGVTTAGTVFGHGYDANGNIDDSNPVLYGDHALKNPESYCVKMEVYVPEELPMQGSALTLGFYENGTTDGHSVRKWGAAFQPCELVYDKPAEGGWTVTSVKPWTSGGDWLTIAIPMTEFRFDLASASICTSMENGRLITDDPGNEYKYFGDTKGGLPYMLHPDNAPDVFAADAYDDGVNPYAGFAVAYNHWTYVTQGVPVFIAVDNVRIAINDQNGGVYPMLNWGVPTQDFFVKPHTTCVAK